MRILRSKDFTSAYGFISKVRPVKGIVSRDPLRWDAGVRGGTTVAAERRTNSAQRGRRTASCVPAGAAKRLVDAQQSCRKYTSSSSSSSSSPYTTYEQAFSAASRHPEKYWHDIGRNIDWFEPYGKTLHIEDPVFPNWFVGGKVNVCHNAVDHHVENGRGEQPAILYDSPVTETKQTITFRELQDQVSRLAGVLVKNGVQKGDLVVIYMPMIPQAMFTMLACARIGAPHSLIFGGFASRELSIRIDHAKERASMSPDLALDWEEEMAAALPHDCVSLPSNHPLYVLYTSGTTGTPKGIVRDTAGYAVMLKWTMSNIYGLSPGDVWWAASDLGWVVGHSYICYGPLLHGNTTILYEGKPVGTPDPGAFFRVLSEHGASSMFTAPTAIRAICQQDPSAAVGRKYPLTRLRSLFLAGERCDVETLEWAKKSFGVPVLDHWWQTETGSAITSSCIGLGNSLTPPAGQAGKPVPGYNVTVIDDDMREVKPRILGNIVVRLPLPPGAALSLWQNQELFRKLYFTKFSGYYDTMDSGFVDEEGFLYIMSRTDDVINVAGHRLSAGALEESLLQHPGVVDCAVVGLEDSLKGHVPLALCVLKNGIHQSQEEMVKEMVKLIRDAIGPVAAFRRVLFVSALPKTRSGKIPRSSLANLVNGKPYKITPTIEDPKVFKDIERQVQKALRPAGL
ncbi:acyl-CoA synthetase short-chain family member 3, mitochondrial isoform X2 [Lampris incognitus]|uniref:acyl-CoA synthetase short-chain family member 3, mitochondrial isoform X2 n=1 Tax=Lampris incognitus TaxID=2546036 RepID=UPI0024B55051|nr:acyl-CoA synthetase short-chain family member 3, mitochondrial isoform X2 [Lampris incognitus]